MDKKIVLFGVFVILLGLVGANLTLQADIKDIPGLNAYINISIEGYPTVDNINWTWAGGLSKLYDDDLLLMLNFENLSVLGENATHIADLSKYSNNFTEYRDSMNSTWVSGGKYGGGWSFKGFNGYLLNRSEIILNENSTISLWIYPYSRTSAGLFYGGSSSDFYGLFVTTNTPMRLGYNLNASIGLVCAPAIEILQNWTHIVMVKESTGIKLYKDGALCANQTVSLNGRIDHIKTIGANNYASSNYFNGTMDEIMVWNRSLTEDEISQLYSIGLQKVDADKWYFQANETLVAGDNNWNFTISNSTATESVFGNETIPVYYNLTDCGNLNISGGIYTLLNNVSSNGTCFTAIVNNVTLDGAGYEINYSTNRTVGYGVYSRYNYTTVKNARIKVGQSSTVSLYGIYFYGADNGLIQNNTILTTGGLDYGIYLDTGSDSGTIISNSITTTGGSSYTIYLKSSSSANVSDNIMETTSVSGGGSAGGVFLSSSNNNYLDNNDIKTGGTASYGFYLTSSSYSTFTRNRANLTYAISYLFEGNKVDYVNHSIDETNLVDGKPINYTFGAQDIVIADGSSKGLIVCGGCNNVTYENVSTPNLYFYWTNNSVIQNSAFNNSNYGHSIDLKYSNSNRIINNTIRSALGVWLTTSYDNDMFGNNILTQISSGHAFYLSASSNNNITNNVMNTTATGGGGVAYGVYLYTSSINNKISDNQILVAGASSSGIYLIASANANYLNNNTINTTSATAAFPGIYVGSSDNIISNTTIGTLGTSSHGISFVGTSTNNALSGLNIQVQNASAIWLTNATSFNFKITDSVLNSLIRGEFYTGTAIGTWNFTNVTRVNDDPINVTWINGINGTLNMMWYLNVNVTNSTGYVDGVNVSVYDTTDASNVYINSSIVGYPTVNQINWTWESTNYSIYDRNLIVMYNFDNISALGENSTNVVDVSQYSNNGTVYNAVWNPSGVYGGGYEFDGTNYLNVSDAISGDNYTMSVWINSKRIGNLSVNGYFMNRGDGGANQYDAVGVTGASASPPNRIGVYNGGTTLAGNTGIIPYTWNYVTFVRTNSTYVQIYLNGVLKIDGTLAKSYDSGTIYLGVRPDKAWYFNGTIDEFRVWNRSLTAEEINQSYWYNLNKYNESSWSLRALEPATLYENYSWEFAVSDDSTRTSNTGSGTAGHLLLGFGLTNANGYLDNKFTLLQFSENSSGFTWYQNNLTAIKTGYGVYMNNSFNLTNNMVMDVILSMYLNGTIISPNITITNTNNTSQNFSINLSSNIGLDNATLNIYFTNDTLYNQTTYTFSGELENAINVVVGLVEGAFKWFFSIFDTLGSQFTSTNQTIFVDSIYPSIDFVSPTPSNGSGKSGEFTINVSITEANLVNITYNWNGTNYTLQNFKSIMDDLVLLMNFDNLSAYGENATHVYDYSGTGNNGTVYNNATFNETGRFGGAYEFDRVSGWVKMSSVPTALSVGQNMTISFWFKGINSLSTPTEIIFNSAVNTTDRFGISTKSSTVRFGKWNGAAFVATKETGSLSNDLWYHAVYTTTSNNTAILYLNNVLQSDDVASPDTTYLNQFTIGHGDASNDYYNGTIDEVGIWNRTLSASEISQLYNSSIHKYDNLGLEYMKSERGRAIINFESNDSTNQTWRLNINQSNLVSGEAYSYYVSVYDLLNHGNATDTRIIFGNIAPSYSNITSVPNSTALFDPGAQVNITANVSDTDGNFDSAILQWKNDSDTSWTNITMNNVTAIVYSMIMNASFTLPNYEANITYRILANDTAGSTSVSNNYTIPSFWDCTWTSTNDLGATAGWAVNKQVGVIEINNTGDIEYTNNNCSLDFRFTHDLPEGRIYFDNDDVKPSDTYTVTASNNISVYVNASFLSEFNSESPKITISEYRGRSNSSTNNVSLDLVTNNVGPYLYEKITTYPTIVYLTTDDFNLNGYLKNLMGSTTPVNNNTAFNVTSSWILPTGLTNTSGNLTRYYDNLSDNNLNYLTSVIGFSDLASMDAGTGTIVFSSYGYNESWGRILDANGNNQINTSISVEFVCYSTADGVYVTSCGTADGDAPVTTTTTTGATTGGGGGGGKGSENLLSRFIKSRENFELLIGKQQEFILDFQNPYPNASLNDLILDLSGLLSDYISVSPPSIKSIPAYGSREITIKITSPSYFTEGDYKLVLRVNGKISGEGNFMTEKEINLKIVEVTAAESIRYMEEANSSIEDMKNKNFTTREVEGLFVELEKASSEGKYSTVKKLYDEIINLYDTANKAHDLLFELKDKIRESEANGVHTPETTKMVNLAEAAFARGDYEAAYSRLKEALLSYSAEVKGEFNLPAYVLNNKLESAGVALAATLLTIGSVLLIRKQLLKNKLSLLDEEEKLLIGLMKVVQRDCFEEAKMSMEEYQEAMAQYERRLNTVVQEKITAETQLANLMKISGGKEKALRVESDRLKELIKQAQKSYFEKAGMETRVYEDMLKSYSSRLSEIEESLATLDAQKALKMHGMKSSSGGKNE